MDDIIDEQPLAVWITWLIQVAQSPGGAGFANHLTRRPSWKGCLHLDSLLRKGGNSCPDFTEIVFDIAQQKIDSAQDDGGSESHPGDKLPGLGMQLFVQLLPGYYLFEKNFDLFIGHFRRYQRTAFA